MLISRHIKNVFEEGELSADSTVAFLQQFKQKIVGMRKENPPQEAFLSVQEKV